MSYKIYKPLVCSAKYSIGTELIYNEELCIITGIFTICNNKLRIITGNAFISNETSYAWIVNTGFGEIILSKYDCSEIEEFYIIQIHSPNIIGFTCDYDYCSAVEDDFIYQLK